MTLMGLTSLDAKSLKGYPHGMDMPQDATGKQLLHFDWKHNDKWSINSNGINQVFEHIQANGAINHPPAADSMSKMLNHHLREKITQIQIYGQQVQE